MTKKKIVIVTGVGKGFGLELFRCLLEKYFVVGLTRAESDIRSLEEIIGKNKECALFDIDISNYTEVSKLISGIQERYGEIYGLINNAGVRFRKDFCKIELTELEDVFAVNVMAAFNLTKLCLPSMQLHGVGRIINISSIIGERALPQLAGYAMSKGALNSMTKSVAVEFAESGITCNAIAPGFCETSYFPNFAAKKELYEFTIERTPMRRWGKADELTGITQFLLSDSASYITGSIISIDGGWSAC